MASESVAILMMMVMMMMIVKMFLKIMNYFSDLADFILIRVLVKMWYFYEDHLNFLRNILGLEFSRVLFLHSVFRNKRSKC